jgi:murein DD-endopeptidase MepM/ murein hydrolase activator NlpD
MTGLVMALVGAAAVSAAPAAGLDVSHRARAIAPGELVIVIVKSDTPLSAVRGRAFGHEVGFYEANGPTGWQGLVGIDLDVKPGTYDVAIEATPKSGSAVLKAAYALHVQPKTFPTRHLTVDEGYVNPPASVVKRITEESRRMRDVLAGFTPRLWWGEWQAPVPGEATSSFGRRSVLNGQPRSPHSGTDFHAATGTPVRAPNRGRVVLAADLYFSGNTVVLDHGQGLFSFLAHLSSIAVHDGQVVSRGEEVGLSGATGRVTGPHLHWTVRVDGARVDPLSLLALLGGKT